MTRGGNVPSDTAGLRRLLASAVSHENSKEEGRVLASLQGAPFEWCATSSAATSTLRLLLRRAESAVLSSHQVDRVSQELPGGRGHVRLGAGGGAEDAAAVGAKGEVLEIDAFPRRVICGAVGGGAVGGGMPVVTAEAVEGLHAPRAWEAVLEKQPRLLRVTHQTPTSAPTPCVCPPSAPRHSFRKTAKRPPVSRPDNMLRK